MALHEPSKAPPVTLGAVVGATLKGCADAGADAGEGVFKGSGKGKGASGRSDADALVEAAMERALAGGPSSSSSSSSSLQPGLEKSMMAAMMGGQSGGSMGFMGQLSPEAMVAMAAQQQSMLWGGLPGMGLDPMMGMMQGMGAGGGGSGDGASGGGASVKGSTLAPAGGMLPAMMGGHLRLGGPMGMGGGDGSFGGGGYGGGGFGGGFGGGVDGRGGHRQGGNGWRALCPASGPLGPDGPLGNDPPASALVVDGALRRLDASGGLFVGAYSPLARRRRLERFWQKRRRLLAAGRASDHAGRLLPAPADAEGSGAWGAVPAAVRAERMIRYSVRKDFAVSRMRVKGRFVKKEDEGLLRELMSIA